MEKRLARDLEQRIKRLNEMNPSFNQLKINQDTISKTWWGLYSAREMADLHKTVSFSPAHTADQRRQLFTARYDSSGPAYVDFKDPLLLAAAKSSFYLDGGFLADKTTALPVRLQQPAGHLLLYKTMIGDAGEIMLCRIDHNGAVAWQLNTHLKKWIDYMIRDNRLFIFGNDNKEINSSECNLLLIAELNSGSVKKYDYFKDELRK